MRDEERNERQRDGKIGREKEKEMAGAPLVFSQLSLSKDGECLSVSLSLSYPPSLSRTANSKNQRQQVSVSFLFLPSLSFLNVASYCIFLINY